jgi:hypothetical protein
MERSVTKEGLFTGTEEGSLAEEILMGGSLVETITGAGAIVLAILGLVGILPEALLAVSTIAIGSAFLMASGSITSRFNKLFTKTTRTMLEAREMAIGMTIEFISGVAGIALGVLSLVGLLPLILLPAAAMVYGFALLFGIGVQARLNDLEAQCNAANESVRRVVRETVSAASGMQMLFGLGAVTLGIVALVGFLPITLALAAMLSVGGATLFTHTAVSARMWGFTTLCELPQSPGVT